MSVKLLVEHHLEFLSLKGGCIGSSESTFVKMQHRWKSHVTAQLFNGFVGKTSDMMPKSRETLSSGFRFGTSKTKTSLLNYRDYLD